MLVFSNLYAHPFGVNDVNPCTFPIALVLLFMSALHAIAQPVNEDVLIKEGKRLTAAEIQQLHADKTVFHENTKSGVKIPIWYAADGTRAFRAGNRLFSGGWNVKDDQRCEETIAGPVVCMLFYRRNDEVFACDPREAPDCRWILRKIVAGDTEGLGKR